MDVEQLVVSLGLNPDDFRRGMQETQRVAQEGGRQIAESFIGPLKGALAALAGGFAFSNMLNTFTSQADAAGKLADSMDTDVETMLAWGEAATRAGGSSEAFQATFRSLNSQINVLSATGKSRLLPIFEEMGIKAKDAGGKTKDTYTILNELAGKAETMGKAQFAGLAQRLGIDQGTIMLLQSGRNSVEELVKRQKMLGVYTKEDARVAANYNDAIADLGQVSRAMSALLMRAVVPAITWVTNKLVDLISFLRQHQPFVVGFFSIVSAVALTKGVPAMLSFAKATWTAMAPFLPLIAAAAALALVFDDLWAFITGGNSVLERIMLRFGMTKETIEGIRTTLRNVAGFFLDLWDAVTGEGVDADAAWDRVKQSWEEAKTWFRQLGDNLLKWFGNLFSRIKKWLADLLPDWLRNMLDSGDADAVKQAAQAGDKEAQAAFDMANGSASWGAPLARAASTIPTEAQLLQASSGYVTHNETHKTTQTINVGGVTVHTEATDAQGMASGAAGALRSSLGSFGAFAADTGVRQ